MATNKRNAGEGSKITWRDDKNCRDSRSVENPTAAVIA
jgi:hypothetical protein